MNKSMILSLALSAATLAGFGGATIASAQSVDRYGQSSTRWRDHDVRQRDFTGVWRLDERRGNTGGWNNGRDYGRNHGQGRGVLGVLGYQQFQLPQVIQIERSRRNLRVENQNGRLIRLIEAGRRGDWNGNRFEVESTVRGAKITEIFMLQSRGRELVVRTIVEGPRGSSRQFTSVYDRA